MTPEIEEARAYVEEALTLLRALRHQVAPCPMQEHLNSAIQLLNAAGDEIEAAGEASA